MEFIDLKAQYRFLKDNIDARIQKVLDHGQFIMGPEVQELEEALANVIGVSHVIGVSSGTDALLMALMALEVGPNDEVITTPFSFAATAETIALLGAQIKYVDIDPNTYNLDPKYLQKAISPKTKAIMPVSLYGQCANFKEINAIAKEYHIPVIEDAAQSLGARHYGEFSGNLTTLACTSFFPSKPLGGYGDGGAIFTNDESLAKTLRQIRLHGQSQRYYHTRLGMNGRLDTLQAAILLAKLTVFSEEIDKRQKIADYYHEQLAACVKIPFIESYNTSVYAQYTIAVENRDEIVAALQEKNIPTAIHYPLPLHLQPGLKAFTSLESQDCPIAEKAANQVLSLPMHPYLEASQQKKIIEVLGNCFK